MTRVVQRSLIAYLPTRKNTHVVSQKDEQQQQTGAAQRKKLLTVAPQLVESVRPASPAQLQHKRQRLSRTDPLKAVTDRSEAEQSDSSQQQQPAQHNEHHSTSAANEHAIDDTVDTPPSPQAAPPSSLLPVPTSTPHRSSPAPTLSYTSLESRRSPSKTASDRSFLSSEQRRGRDFIEQTVRDCFQPLPHIPSEPSRAQHAALVRPPAASRPPLSRLPKAAPTTASKRPHASVQASVSSTAALSAAASTSTPSVVRSDSSLHLPLPVSYRLLVSIFSAVECATTVRSHSSVLWSILCPAVIRIVQKTVALSHMQQLACLMPDCYELREERSADSWGRLKVDVRVARLRLSDEEKGADTKASSETAAGGGAELAVRRQLLEQRLLDRAIDEHNHWHSSSPHASQPVNPLAESRWHTAFPLDSLPPLPKAEVKGAAKDEKVSALDALESLAGHKRKWEEVEPLTPRSFVSRASSNGSELLLTPSTRSSSTSTLSSLLDTPVSDCSPLQASSIRRA